MSALNKNVLSVSLRFSNKARELIYKTSRFCFSDQHTLRTLVNWVPASTLETPRALESTYKIIPRYGMSANCLRHASYVQCQLFGAWTSASMLAPKAWTGQSTSHWLNLRSGF